MGYKEVLISKAYINIFRNEVRIRSFVTQDSSNLFFMERLSLRKIFIIVNNLQNVHVKYSSLDLKYKKSFQNSITRSSMTQNSLREKCEESS